MLIMQFLSLDATKYQLDPKNNGFHKISGIFPKKEVKILIRHSF